MTDQHPIAPPPELAKKWYIQAPDDDEMGLAQHIATQAARWGADKELEACCAWIPEQTPWDADKLRAARRPQPPSLKEQALLAIDTAVADDRLSAVVADVVRRALEALPNE